MNTPLSVGLKNLFDLFFPRTCIDCGRAVENSEYDYLCRACSEKLTLSTPPNCNTCGYPFLSDWIISKHCPHCTDLNPAFNKGHTLFLAKGVGRKMIHSLKYKNGLFVLSDIRKIIKKLPHLKPVIKNAILVPVPLHRTKLRERGFNQSSHFAQLIHSLFIEETEVASVLVRKKFTPSQTNLSRDERGTNVKNAFELAPKIKLDFNKKYILLDDVFTTGNTLNECAKVLKRSGIKSIELLAIGHG